MYTKIKKYLKVEQYIIDNWLKCVRNSKKSVSDLIELPYNYTVPSKHGGFQHLFYWDTYFTNIGLIKLGKVELAKANVDNMIFEVNQYGFVPNFNSRSSLNRSQPPYLSMMVRDIYEVTKDKTWLERALVALKKEYAFWMGERITPTGLNRHFHSANQGELVDFYERLKERLSFSDIGIDQKIRISSCHLAEAETGWDFNPRFGERCPDFLPIDLNSNLCLYEKNFAHFTKIMDKSEGEPWIEKANKRIQLINQHCYNSSQRLFMDYDYVNKKFSEVKCLASFFPLWAGFATEEQAKSTIESLKEFEYNYGISACTKGARKHAYQWDYPNGWPPLFYIVINGLLNYGHHEDAKRIAKKYVELVTTNFEKTGELWEKYNVVDGSIDTINEYSMLPVMGWTAGVFLFAIDII